MQKYELLALIRQAKRESWTELDLSHQRLAELPSDIGKLSEVGLVQPPDRRLGNVVPDDE
jgi:hypothetical protein